MRELLTQADENFFGGLHRPGAVIGSLKQAVRLVALGLLKTYEAWQQSRGAKDLKSLNALQAGLGGKPALDLGEFLGLMRSSDFRAFARDRLKKEDVISLVEQLKWLNDLDNDERHKMIKVNARAAYRRVMGIGVEGLIPLILRMTAKPGE